MGFTPTNPLDGFQSHFPVAYGPIAPIGSLISSWIDRLCSQFLWHSSYKCDTNRLHKQIQWEKWITIKKINLNHLYRIIITPGNLFLRFFRILLKKWEIKSEIKMRQSTNLLRLFFYPYIWATWDVFNAIFSAHFRKNKKPKSFFDLPVCLF